ncbi:MAG TPA: valine--tRNA ligase [Gemmatimonadaceae bacterium]|nr:valine--tRNA ligase [Gemmatimonadaceae bacterium]
MSTTALPSQYDHVATERALYERWQGAGIFTAHAGRSRRAGGEREPFTIMMPPPNVTAVLHMGHGLNNTVQDVMTRWRRMCGDEALWLPGTDHAGIATQNVIEKQLAREGLTRQDLGREAFVARTEGFVEETGGGILQQLRALGASCDWSRTAYTLSPALSRAVREAFVRLFERGLIYRGHRVIHWCPRCLTSLSDEEAEFHDTAGTLYHIRYPLTDDPANGIVVATTRPETMLGDVAVAVHPEDERYAALVGRTVRMPVTGIELPVIADPYADPAFGTGVVKITPAHDANDYEVGVRHNLPMPVVISATGTMDEGSDAAGRVPAELAGLDRFDARTRIVEQLRADGFLVKAEPHQHAVRRCYRCNTIVEPRLSDQWFVKMKPLAEPALRAVRDGTIRILPQTKEAIYINWLEGIRDWNISRQLWWGHRIPVWYCDGCGQVSASRTDLTSCPACNGPVHQDEDVLDTWFSSGLWPFSTLGWPDDTADLRAFYPTDQLITAPEILFFWVARMIMNGFEFMGQAPFHTVYLHGTVRDTHGVKMSKSLGNGIDPLDVVSLYGADALRWTVVAGMGLGADTHLDPKDLEQSFATGRNFATKLWHIGRYLLMNVGDRAVTPVSELAPDRLALADRWILDRLRVAIADCDAALGPARPHEGVWREEERYAGLRLNEYAEAARRFVWNELADWYVESVKPRLLQDGPDSDVARSVLVHTFDAALRLLQPIVPFITDALWQQLPGRTDGEFLAVAEWPRRTTESFNGESFDVVRNVVVAIRQLRGEYRVPPGKRLVAHVRATGDARDALVHNADLVAALARCTLEFADALPTDAAAHQVLDDGTELALPLAGLVDVERECERLGKELSELDRQLTSLSARLQNPAFVSRAKPEVVEAERAKEQDWTARRTQLASRVQALCGG